MFKKSLVLAAAIFAGTFCTAHAAGGVATRFVTTELSCLSGTSCTVRVQLPANKLIRLKGISCVNVSANVTSADIQIAKDSIIYFNARLYQWDVNNIPSPDVNSTFMYQEMLIDTKAHEVWINLNSTVAGQMAATCYAAY